MTNPKRGPAQGDPTIHAAFSNASAVSGRRAADANPCNLCATKKTNPCAKTGANPCNPCGATRTNPCGATNPCNPCGGSGRRELAALAAYVEHLQPGFDPNPFAMKSANPCNPCGARRTNPCGAKNPCGR